MRISLWITRIGTSTMLRSTERTPSRPQKKAKAPSRSRPGNGCNKKSPLLRIASTPPAWAACLAAFQQELTPQQFATWIRPLACADDAGKLKLTAPNRFVLQWVKDRFSSRIETRVRQASGTMVSIDLARADGAPVASKAAAATAAAPPP